MTVIELAKRLQVAINQGAGKNEVCVHQWLHGMQEVTAVEVRPDGTLELYSGTVALERFSERVLADRFGERVTPPAPEDDDPTAGLFDDEDDLI